jgi:hypothetical protein
MFHRCIAVLLVAVSLFLHGAPVVMAAQGALPAVPLVDEKGQLNPDAKVGSVINFSSQPTVFVPNAATSATFSGNLSIAPQIGPPAPGQVGISFVPSDLVPKLTGTEGKWDLPDFDKFFADNPYLSQLICMTPGFISDLLNIAAGIFSLLGPFLGILGVFVSDPSNTVTNIQQLMTMTQQLKSMFEQCKNQKRINSVLGTTAPPVDLAKFMAHSLGRYGETSFQASVRSENPQWFGGSTPNGFSANSSQGILETGLQALSTVQLFTGAIGEITGDAGIKQFATDLTNFQAQAQSLINVVFSSIQVFTNAFTQIGSGGNPITTAQQIAGTIISVMGPFNGGENSDPAQFTLEAAEASISLNPGFDISNPNAGGSSDQSNSGKLKVFKDKKLSGGAGTSGAATADKMYAAIEKGLTGRGSNAPKAECQATVTRYRLDAARNCALKCAATSLNYVNNSAIKAQQLVSNSGGCVVAGQNLPKSLCPTLTEVVANSGSVRGDIQSLVAIEFYGLTADLAMGEVTALCTACEGIKGLIGTPTECR